MAACAAICGVLQAQQSSAMLQHAGQSQYFHGVDAFEKAVAAAQPKDVIILSAGSFTLPDEIRVNNLTIKGVGCMPKDSTDVNYTLLATTRNFCFNCDSLVMEGCEINPNSSMIYVANKGHRFSKCKLNRMELGRYNTLNASEVYFTNCIFDSFVKSSVGMVVSSIYFENCIVRPGNLYGGPYYFNHCFLISGNDEFYMSTSTSEIKNSICYYTTNNDYKVFNESNKVVCSNNIIIAIYYDNGANMAPNVVIHPDNISTIFKDYKEDDYYGTPLQLTDEAKAKYIGSDDTEIGIYGGFFPYTTKVTYPTIFGKLISHNVKDGILKVKVSFGNE